MARFRASARTVDMLGRQQIAGVPTAISELFKNAHDAYALEARADYVRYEDLFVLRDDGVGMTREQFERRWLTLGTASKLLTDSATPPPKGMRRRAVLGEKGIGRLAIAAIGPQVLVLTRARSDGDDAPVTAALIHWGSFEIPDVDLDDIEIPIVEFMPREEPDVSAMAEQIVQNVQALAAEASPDLVHRMVEDLARWSHFDAQDLAETLGLGSLVGSSGTCFVIVPASPDLAADLQAPERKEAAPLLKTLIGFAETMTPGHAPPELRTAFYDRRAPDHVVDLISESEFFTPDEFIGADHHFRGSFDEYGQFHGTVQVFGGEPVEYPLAWTGARGARTQCGPFDLNLAYVQGFLRESSMGPDEWRRIMDKLYRYGGLYIYRDGIRVLPYGDNRFDWLDVELRRAKSASDAFFSYRRMFGVVSISREHNARLREKAGREGFTSNEAYRQFRSILMGFLEQVTMEFFREGSARSLAWEEGRKEHTRLDKARRARSSQVRVRRRQLRDDLDAFFADIDIDGPAERAQEIVAFLRSEVEQTTRDPEPSRAAARLASAEATARGALREIEQGLEIRRRGFGLTKELQRDVLAYEREVVRVRSEVVVSTLEQIEAIVTAAGDEKHAALQRRVRFDEALRTVSESGRGTLQHSRRELNAATSEAATQSRTLVRTSFDRVDAAVQEVLIRAARLDVAAMPEREFVMQRDALEERIRSVATEQARALESVTDQLRAVAWPVNGDGPLITVADQVEDMETRLEAFMERAEQDLELTQLGLAVEIINHEFQTSIRAIRENLRRLRGWASANRELRPVYRDLRGAFDHLDGYLKLFTPLHRRLYRKPVNIRGADLERFVRDVFRERLDMDGIELEASPQFRDHIVQLFPSTLYPVFVNLVDNAVHWLTEYGGRREITLDIDGEDMTITDTGPGIGERDREAVFELGFSRKPGGTGYGLYISREVLRREGMDLLLDPPDPDRGARFRIVFRPGEGPAA